MEAKQQEFLRIFRVYLDDPTISSICLIPHEGGAPKYETGNMFQGKEDVFGVEHNRRVYKSSLDKPFITVEDDRRVLKMYSLSDNKDKAKQTLIDYMSTYYEDRTDSRVTESAEEEQTIEALEKW
jgi:hypothetical protein